MIRVRRDGDSRDIEVWVEAADARDSSESGVRVLARRVGVHEEIDLLAITEGGIYRFGACHDWLERVGIKADKRGHCIAVEK